MSTSLSTSSSKSGPTPSGFYGFYVKASSRYSLVHILPTSSSKSGPRPPVFDDFYVINYLMTMWSTNEMKLSLQSRAHFVDLTVDLIFKKWSDPVRFLRFLCESELLLQSRAHFVDLIFSNGPTPSVFYEYICEIDLSLQSRAHCLDHFRDRGAKPRKQTISSGKHRRPLYPKKHRVFAPESIFSREFTRSRSLTLPNYFTMM